MTDGWENYRRLVEFGDYDAALAEAFTVAPKEPDPVFPGCSRDFYIHHMVDNNLPVEKRRK